MDWNKKADYLKLYIRHRKPVNRTPIKPTVPHKTGKDYQRKPKHIHTMYDELDFAE